MQADGTTTRDPHLKINLSRLDSLRDAHGIPTDAELARRIGVHPGTLMRVREGSTIASNQFLAKLALAFPHVTKDDLFLVDAGGDD